jgi:hypothetical protein
MGREAVRQPPDPRLDRELTRMGLLDAPGLAKTEPAQSTVRSAEIDAELERLRKRLRRTALALSVLAAVTAILAVMVVILLTR